MENDEIKTRIRAILREHLGPAAEMVIADTDKPWKTGKDIGPGDLDSLDKIEFIMAIEREFDVEISDALAAQAASINEFTALVGTLLCGKADTPN